MPDQNDYLPLMAVLHEPRAEINNRAEILFTIHHAVPRSLRQVFLATHFVHTTRSFEDICFDLAVYLARQCFGGERDQQFPGLFLSSPRIESSIMTCIRAQYDTILHYSPSSFVFGCESAILSLLTRRVTDQIGHVPSLDLAFATFAERYRAFFPATYRDFLTRLRVAMKGVRLDEVRIKELGGVRQWLETNERDGETANQVEDALGEFRHLRLKSHATDPFVKQNISYQLRWTRLPQGWTYSFIESLELHHASIRDTDLTERDRKKSEYLQYLTSMIIGFAIDPNVPNASGIAAVPKDVWFPGAPLAGAHYLMLGVDSLVAVSVAWPHILGHHDDDPDAEAKLATRIRNHVRKLRKTDEGTGLDGELLDVRIADFCASMNRSRGARIAAAQKLFSTCITILGSDHALAILHWHSMSGVQKSEIRKILEATRLPEDISNMSLAEYQGYQLIAQAAQGGAVLSQPDFFEYLGKVVREAINERTVSREDRRAVFRELAELTRCFWESTLGWATQSLMRDADDDYVASAMVDFHCLYFSNFIPVGKEMFTRTIFVDIGLEGYQRGRMLQRLCDILTYRSLAIRDLDRVRAAIEGSLEISRTLNDIQATMAGPQSFAGREEASFLQQQLSRVIDVAGRAGYMNSFLTYGIVGRRMSAQVYLDQILERCVDVREERLTNFPMLKDFVERRLAHSVRNFDRMHMHYTTIGQRITELMDMIRTRLGAVQTHEMTTNLYEQTEAARTIKEASSTLQIAANRVNANLEAQIDLQVAAEAIVLVAGTYYAYSIVHAISESLPERHRPDGWVLVCIGLVICLIVRAFAAPIVILSAPLARRAYTKVSTAVGIWRRRR